MDLLIISLLSYFSLTKSLTDIVFFAAFWVVLSTFFSFYEVYRFTKIVKVVSLLFRLILVLGLTTTSYFYIIKSEISPEEIINFLLVLFFAFGAWRVFLHGFLKKYRLITGSNYKQVIIIGSNESTRRLEKFFQNQRSYGYRFLGYFTDKDENEKQGSIKSSFNFIIENSIDEVYCSVNELNNDQIKEFIEFSDVNIKTLKFIPDNKEIYTKALYLNHYDLMPILSLRKIPLDDPVQNLIKRSFDVVFSLAIIFFVLSWLIPILGTIIVIESRGPIFFRQNRPGIKEKGFGCYKFRSMSINSRSEESASRNDPRVTKVGRFIRRTSIDELPQFFNVLFGSMSVVGPRPHLWRQNELYGTKVPKYMVRYFAKPGITGLAQVRGYRGEIETREDIVNRTKYDIFYIENWSLLMDFNIIIQTVLNVLKGEDKAY
ncbi:exopolysaccharide biosynthesis polyprenyl glycosylphosphotransferase [Flavivirga abyssicola]|uniref:exopolysaccharide biosynthesis polyprenyl glycosylphosphotransferase n=1 Tax=Flavivirga abyssicola TaxID=3063533 RepID=UPI0026E089D8|nr:exopolysaccharide biosynthesis polyprenyl glycosylphosphotransferase [Flavivirga sp. MEBiC07777]WVK14787.1 exopolysaccharide biosynthesis polyprenyl glycosylphosphotransferase [Flavivirga sp. MEBiC07777]